MAWLLVDQTSGEMVGAPSPQEPTGYDSKQRYAVRTPLGFPERVRWLAARRGFVDLTTEKWNGTTWIDDIAKVEAQLVAGVKAEAERRKMLALSPGSAKKTEYADKYREVAAWDSLAGSVTAVLIAFNAMPTATKTLRFPYAMASAAAFGDTPSDAIARFKAGIGRSTSVPALAAAEEKTCAAIKAATTIAAKGGAAAATFWPA